ncbi:kinase-like protein [Cylindrobasidium torrendii FP15055 ss-10]|uniref:non-specific serine/threonine protein kinase n=1 Tax=Cylindrobasidium torrendii FP15055 ss-10 TaxID=1314674 RepID=A0A0D7BNY3_9AGAR|nr:kinase-like protein [Cylindrobasidium torrendii FP15055 ss-10]
MANIPPSTKSKVLSTLRRDEDDNPKPYVLIAEIGKGSFATVYKGAHEDTNVQVAIKTVRRDNLSAKLFENLQSEIQILKTLSHRHITRLTDIIRSERHIFLIMEYCSGGDLTNYIKKRGRVETLEYVPSEGAAPQYYPHPRTGGLAEIVVRSFLRQLARALKFLHHKHYIHRDIKPQNLLLKPAPLEELAKGHPQGVPILKVADFGFARSLPSAMMAETLCGSPLYMAPEILGYHKYDAKADLWSVGAVLYEMSVGKPPFRANNHIELLKKIETSKGIKFPDEDPTSTAAKSGGGGSSDLPVPSDVKKLIRSLLKQRPVERASYEEFFSSQALAKSKFPRPRDPSPPETPMDESRPNWPGRPPTPPHHREIPPEVLDPTAMIPPSKFNFRRPSNQGEGLPKVGPVPNRHVAPPPPAKLQPAPSQLARLQPGLEVSVIPGESKEDSLDRREYVMVFEPQAVEFNRTVDEITTGRKALAARDIPPSSPAVDTAEYRPHTTFPPAPNTSTPPLSQSPSRAASNTLSRALSLASRKLFGHRHTTSKDSTSSTRSSPRRPQIIALDSDGERDPLEDQLLAQLEELAQKTDVITHWADEMYEYVKAVPQKPLPDPEKFESMAGEGEKQAWKRKNGQVEAEYNAVTCVAVYMLLMSFSQKGINKLKEHQTRMKEVNPDAQIVVSEGFDDALSWFKAHFLKCHERATLVKTWLPGKYSGPKAWLDQLVYDRALILSRLAARKELLDEGSPEECEKLYEESLWCLYALEDDLLQTENPFHVEDRQTIGIWIKRTKLRLVRCRQRINMTDRDRQNDVKADVNLVDVARFPAPWDVKPKE